MPLLYFNINFKVFSENTPTNGTPFLRVNEGKFQILSFKSQKFSQLVSRGLKSRPSRWLPIEGTLLCALVEAEEIFFEIVWEFRRKIRQRESERAVADFGVVRCSMAFRVYLEN